MEQLEQRTEKALQNVATFDGVPMVQIRTHRSKLSFLLQKSIARERPDEGFVGVRGDNCIFIYFPSGERSIARHVSVFP